MRRWLLSALVLPWVAVCGPGDSPESATAGAVDFPECPHSYDSLTVFVSERESYDTVAPLLQTPGPRRNVPEYHDCQKFVVVGPNGDLAYDSLFAIFAPADSLGPSQERGMAAPGAEILAWNHYPPLGIGRGVNCLYLWRGPATPWRARMVHVAPWGTPDATCGDAQNPEDLPPGADLDVAGFQGELPATAFPPVARWGWSQADSVQTIEVRCGGAWCAVHPPGSRPPASYHDILADQGAPPRPGTPPEILQRYRVKGWYDEQLLAYDPDPADPANPLLPTGILGRFFPHVQLGQRGPGDFRPSPPDSVWTLVGYVALSVPDGEPEAHVRKYRDVYGLAATADTAHFEEMNRVYLCEGSQSECGVPPSVAACPEDDTSETREWWGRVAGADGGELYRCVTRRGHEAGAQPVPATARWRWAVNDEGMWERCVQGCCEMIGPD